MIDKNYMVIGYDCNKNGKPEKQWEQKECYFETEQEMIDFIKKAPSFYYPFKVEAAYKIVELDIDNLI